MKLTDLLRFAAQNLWRRRLRSVLTVTGVIIGTACIIVMIAIGLGNMEQFNKNFLQNANLTEIRIDNYSERGSSSARTLNESTIATFRQLDGVKAASGMLDMPLFAILGRYEANLYVQAVDASVLSGLELYKGNLFTSAAMPELVIGGSMLANFRDPEETDTEDYGKDGERKAPDLDWLNEGMEIYLGQDPEQAKSAPAGENAEEQPKSRMYKGKISGYTKPGERSERSYNSYISLDIAKKMIQENRKLADNMGLKMNSYNSAIIQAVDMDSVKGIMDKLEEMGYQAYSQAESIESIKEEQGRQQGQLLMIALISLLVSAIGIANTMLTSIMERRSEIGVMKVVGLSIRKINLLFVAESAMIGLTGGILGSLLGYIVAFAINSGTGETVILGMYFGQGAKLLIPFWLTLAATGIAVGVGVLSGLYPAWKATKLSPLEAIRSGN
jgi:putative ABC transport system permease protein